MQGKVNNKENQKRPARCPRDGRTQRKFGNLVENEEVQNGTNNEASLDSKAFCDQMRNLQRLLPDMGNADESPVDSQGSGVAGESRNLDQGDQVTPRATHTLA